MAPMKQLLSVDGNSKNKKLTWHKLSGPEICQKHKIKQSEGLSKKVRKKETGNFADQREDVGGKRIATLWPISFVSFYYFLRFAVDVDSVPLVVVEADPGRANLHVQFAAAQVDVESHGAVTQCQSEVIFAIA